jgi:uncharacterized membrane protein YfcA
MWILYPLLFLAGFIDSIAGGGGLISLTSFLAVGVPPHLALGTNKFSIFMGTGLSAVYFARSGNVEWRAAIYAFVGALIGSSAGSRMVLWVDERSLAVLLLVLIPLVTIFLLLKRDIGVGRNVPAGAKYVVYAFLVGFVIGGYTGFFGPGAGTFFIMAHAAIMGFPILTACGNTKVVNFASNFAATITFMLAGTVDYKLAIPCILCSMLGNHVGTKLAIKNGAKIVKHMMLVVLTLLLIKVAYDALHAA